MVKKFILSIKAKLHTRSGRNALTFMAFIGLSAVLWAVMVLNEEVQRDVRCSVRVTHQPDSVTIISDYPEAVNVSLRAHGSQIVKHRFSGEPVIDIDFRNYGMNNRLSLGETEMRSLVRGLFGSDAQILSVTPDSINLIYTTRPPVILPLTIDAKITTTPQFTLSGPLETNVDSIKVYSIAPLPTSVNTIYTEPIRYDNIERSDRIRVKLIAPQGCRVVPSEVEVEIPVESLISKTRKVLVNVVNAPVGTVVTTFPAMAEVTYMVPMGLYNDVQPDFRVEADFRSIINGSRKMPLQLTKVPAELHNVYLITDSVDFVIEHR